MIDSSPNWQHYITIILYEVHRSSDDPLSRVDWILEKKLPETYVVHRDVLADIEEGLASPVKLSRILPGPHREATIRAFFTLLAEKLRANLDP